MKCNQLKIDYPTSSNLMYKDTYPFIRICMNTFVLYGYATKSIQLFNPKSKSTPKIIIFSEYEKPNDLHKNMLKQATQKVKGMNYQVLYVHEHEFLCLGSVENTNHCFVILDIHLNNKGYYEIMNVKNVLSIDNT